MEIFKLCCAVFLAVFGQTYGYEVLHAVNIGSASEITDSNGLSYQADTECEVSDIYPEDIILGVSYNNSALYASICHGYDTLTRDIPIDASQDGSYLLVLRMIEYTTNRRVSIVLNDQHEHFNNFSIYNVVGNRHAYDEHIFFDVCDNQVLYRNERSQIEQNKIRISLQAIGWQNVILSALVLVRGDVENFPQLAFNQASADSAVSRVFQEFVHSCRGFELIVYNEGTMTVSINRKCASANFVAAKDLGKITFDAVAEE
jgi:hypothetical protein